MIHVNIESNCFRSASLPDDIPPEASFPLTGCTTLWETRGIWTAAFDAVWIVSEGPFDVTTDAANVGFGELGFLGAGAARGITTLAAANALHFSFDQTGGVRSGP